MQHPVNEQRWRRERDDRSLRYAGRRLDPAHWIALSASPDFAHSYEGQVAILSATNLLGRMSPSIALALREETIHPNLPWAGKPLRETALAQMLAADPYGRFTVRDPKPGDFRVHLGSTGHDVVVHGSGWRAFVGSPPSPIRPSNGANPIGAAFAVIMAVSQLFVHNLRPWPKDYFVDTLTWTPRSKTGCSSLSKGPLGNIWVVGAGSVGTAALYYLSLAKLPFSTVVIDMDRVERHNLDRSPMFCESDVGRAKVEVVSDFLAGMGVSHVQIDNQPLHNSKLWTDRRTGEPDLLIPAANEMNVRYHVETRYPPIQLCGTTGRNWQASLIRHIPLTEPCSCCLFPDERSVAELACASGPVNSRVNDDDRQDTTLPFLSFAAGLMTAAELLKLPLKEYPFSSNRVTLYTRPAVRIVSSRISQRPGCLCQGRSEIVHRMMLNGTGYARLSDKRQSSANFSAN